MARSLYENRLIFGFPYTAANLEKMQRAGVAFFHPGLTAQQRQNVLNGTTPIQTVLQSPESGNFQAVWATKENPTVPAWYIGCFSMTSTQWSRLQAFIGTVPQGLRYLRAFMDPDDDKYTILESNIPALQDRIGAKFPDGPWLLDRMGLVNYNAE